MTSAFTVTNVAKPSSSVSVATTTTPNLMRTARFNRRGLNSPMAAAQRGDRCGDLLLSSTRPATNCCVHLTPRPDLDLDHQRLSLEIEKQRALDRFVAEHKKNICQQNTHDESIAAKMLIVESGRFQKSHNSAVLEHTLRPDFGHIGPGCHPSTIQLMLSDVDVIMKNHSEEENGYVAVKKSLGRIPLWGLPTAHGSLF